MRQLHGFEIRLAALERSGLSSDARSLQTELHELKDAVQALQARDQVVLEDSTPTTYEDLAEYVHVQHLIEDDSPIAIPINTKRKRIRDAMDDLGEE
ncbi:hypothetical protein K7X08_016021 [Anisodus acutangulus]|uniref:Uncharacterized protein n=1 Tax=Anisodus acutangulus TaxID=402998 RepID=A0A9Q1LEG7_9SOLA|nr:hypothetical protein K7X08_016021 [Anisodus acutangulus]